jgi:hypothetical protein
LKPTTLRAKGAEKSGKEFDRKECEDRKEAKAQRKEKDQDRGLRGLRGKSARM